MCLSRPAVYFVCCAVVRIFCAQFCYTRSINRLAATISLPLCLSASRWLCYSFILANFIVVDVARVRLLRERRRAYLFARGGGSSVSLPRAVGISISYSTAVDEACYFPCVRRLAPLPSDSSVYTLPPYSRSRLRIHATFVDPTDEVSY